jgi:F-type H+-transporting ATPase subunit gamma
MSVQVRETKRRISGVRQIQKATNAMEMIAAARIARDKTAAMNSQRYTDRLAQLLSELHQAASEAAHPMTAASKAQEMCLVVFGSDRGLCGGFNTALMEKLKAFHSGNANRDLRLIVMGKIVNRRALHHGYKIEHFATQPVRRSAAGETAAKAHALPPEIAQMAALITDSFLKGRFGEIHILYSKFISPLRQEPVVERLLPADLSATPVQRDAARRGEGGGLAGAIFEPAPQAILELLMPEYVRRRIYNAFLNSVASETGARQTSMRRATENAAEMLDELTREYSRLRQEGITGEMIELAAGSMK